MIMISGTKYKNGIHCLRVLAKNSCPEKFSFSFAVFELAEANF